MALYDVARCDVARRGALCDAAARCVVLACVATRGAERARGGVSYGGAMRRCDTCRGATRRVVLRRVALWRGKLHFASWPTQRCVAMCMGKRVMHGAHRCVAM